MTELEKCMAGEWLSLIHISGLNAERSRLRFVAAASVLSARANVQPFFSIHGQASQIVGAHGHLTNSASALLVYFNIG